MLNVYVHILPVLVRITGNEYGDKLAKKGAHIETKSTKQLEKHKQINNINAVIFKSIHQSLVEENLLHNIYKNTV